MLLCCFVALRRVLIYWGGTKGSTSMLEKLRMMLAGPRNCSGDLGTYLSNFSFPRTSSTSRGILTTLNSS